jgi:Zn-dependent M28 family amino/carboxypeptidase
MLVVFSLFAWLQAAPAALPADYLADVRRLAASTSNDGRFDVLTALLEERNVPFAVEEFTPDKPDPRDGRARGRNIVVTLGAGAEDIVVGAHYDVVRLKEGMLGQGAVDNGGSSVMLVHLAAALRGERLGARVRLVWFDMEEVGLVGSRRYVEVHKGDRIRAMLNYDINAYGDTVMFAEPPGGESPALRQTMLETCAAERYDCLRFREMPNSDDRSFGRAGIPTLSVAMLPAVEVHQIWLLLNVQKDSGLAPGFAPAILRTIHTAADSIDKVDGASVARVQQLALALVRRLAAAR